MAVELKLRDFARALSQATLHRLFAHAAFIAMPARRFSDEARGAATRVGVGLLAIDPDGLVDCVVEPRLRPPLDSPTPPRSPP